MLMGLPQGVAQVAEAAGVITGQVYHDFNDNGARDVSATLANDGNVGPTDRITLASDIGLSGVVVTAWDGAGAMAGTTTTAATGAYTLTVTGTGPYRLEFTDFPPGFEPGSQGVNNSSSVRFVPNGNSSNVDLGIHIPSNHCQDNPLLVLPCYVVGDQITGTNSLSNTIVGFPYTAGSNGTLIPPYDQPTTRPILVPAFQVGATWGMAFSSMRQRLYATAFFKKHTGFGPGGPGAIYVINPGTNSVVATYNVPNATTNFHDVTNYATDNFNTAWNAVGKSSLGGIVVTEDQQRLLVMNLEDRRLYALDPDTGAALTSQPVPTTGLPTPGGTNATCAAGDVRPFAVRVHNNVGYAGLVCSAESTQSTNDLFGYVYTFTVSSLAFASSPAFQFELDYPRGIANDGPGQVAAWRPWANTFRAIPPNVGDPNWDFPVYPQPWLTGLAILQDGSLVIGLRDRFGDQAGNAMPSNPASPASLYHAVTAGDLLIACGSPAAGWTLESNARCAGRGTGPQGNGQGPGNGEFFSRDQYAPFHDEVGMGSVLYVAGRPDVIGTTFDPVPISDPITLDTAFDAGVRWFNATSGDYAKAYRLYNGRLGDTFFGKANGLGDIVALCDPAPVEIGNLVWVDTDRDGVQDPNEPPIPNLQVQLFNPATSAVIATATTSAAGNYYFGNYLAGATPRTSTSSAVYTSTIQFNTNYQIRIDLTQAAITVPGYVLTQRFANSGANAGIRDSNGLTVGNFAIYDFNTGAPGQNNHTYDFGFNVAPLAVELTDFRVAMIAGDQVTLTWTTAAEVDNVGFRLYRASTPDRAAAAEVAFVPAASPGGAVYQLVDTTPPGGPWWYWLQDVDTHGTATDHGPVTTDLNLAGQTERLFLPLVFH